MGKKGVLPPPPPARKGLGKGKSKDDSNVANKGNPSILTSSASAVTRCPICSAPGHLARDCPQKGGRGMPRPLVKEPQKPSEGEQQVLANFAKIFTTNGGNPDKVATACDCSVDK